MKATTTTRIAGAPDQHLEGSKPLDHRTITEPLTAPGRSHCNASRGGSRSSAGASGLCCSGPRSPSHVLLRIQRANIIHYPSALPDCGRIRSHAWWPTMGRGTRAFRGFVRSARPSGPRPRTAPLGAQEVGGRQTPSSARGRSSSEYQQQPPIKPASAINNAPSVRLNPECAWCDAEPRGTAQHPDGSRHPSCGRSGHGYYWAEGGWRT